MKTVEANPHHSTRSKKHPPQRVRGGGTRETKNPPGDTIAGIQRTTLESFSQERVDPSATASPPTTRVHDQNLPLKEKEAPQAKKKKSRTTIIHDPYTAQISPASKAAGLTDSDKGSVVTGLIDLKPTATLDNTTERKLASLDSNLPKLANTPSEEIEQEICQIQQPLSKQEAASIETHRRRQARTKSQAKNSTACFTGGTLILAARNCKVQWIPIWTAVKGDIVIQSLPQGTEEDLSAAVTTSIQTVCTFECTNTKSDLVQVGEAFITAHHQIHTNNGWMSARQAAENGCGKLWTDLACVRVYNLALTQGQQHSGQYHCTPAAQNDISGSGNDGIPPRATINHPADGLAHILTQLSEPTDRNPRNGNRSEVF